MKRHRLVAALPTEEAYDAALDDQENARRYVARRTGVSLRMLELCWTFDGSYVFEAIPSGRRLEVFFDGEIIEECPSLTGGFA